VDSTLLQHLIDQELSLAEIGNLHGLHESTVGYWVKKHGLRAAHHEKYRARGGVSRETLEPMVQAGLSIAQIATAVGLSKTAVRHWLHKYSLRTSGVKGSRLRDGTREARETGLSEVELTCQLHGPIMHVRESGGYFRCPRCRQDAVIRRRRRVKQLLVAEAGGVCQLCGYHRCLAALQFHHLDPKSKKFTIAQRGAHSIERLRVEAHKCVLLCANCHAEVEAGLVTLPASNAA
jgi:hypothetical protein